MKWTGVNDLRESFLKFYESKGHLILPSFGLVPKDDNSLLLINSGMAPMKNYFLGVKTPPRKRVTTCQKCIRTPDIERVGKTARHGTYFEMLGNFSFGDYFKHEATAWAWEFLTKVLEIPAERLYVSIFEDDDQAAEIWTKEVGVDPTHIVRLGREDNFWEIGSGPCGPCSEIYYDRGEKYGCGKDTCGVGCDCDRFMEIWNLVFTQFNSDGEGNYTPLEHPNIDTGMGLERLACVMQDVDNLFEVDTVANIMKHVSEIAGVTYKENEKSDVSLRVITDHIRSTTFMIGDGIVPQNEGRGYVLRRLLRRAARHGRLLGINEPFLYKVADTVIRENQPAYPELLENRDYIVKIIQVEEERFAKTIDQGMTMLSDLIDRISSKAIAGEQVLSGAEAFKLYDTFGFPLDLTMEIAEERGVRVDENEFTQYMNDQRERARAARAAMGDMGWEGDVLSGIPGNTEFVGYQQLSCSARVLAIIKDGQLADGIAEGESGVIVLDRTCFYGEGGGQVGDTGLLSTGKCSFKVLDTKKSVNTHYMHIGTMESGLLSVGDEVLAEVNQSRRRAIMRNHSACHLLQAALREVLGTHVHQSGSYVDEAVCRFDFSHFNAMTAEELSRVEYLVNDMILSALPVVTENMGIEDAKGKGAMALFGEKYGDVVRVVDMGSRSVELCGGTHVDNTSKIGLFKIVKESSIAAGVRRIEAVTGRGVLNLIDAERQIMNDTCEVLKVGSPAELPAKAASMVAEVKGKEREIEEWGAKVAAMQAEALENTAIPVGSVKLIYASLNGIKPDILRKMSDRFRDIHPDIVTVFSTILEGKASIAASCGKDAVKDGIHAGQLVKEICSLLGGSGGGRPDSAMGGASDIFKIDEVFVQVPSMVEKMLESKKSRA
ncbi:MAG: alanine--tRNA ligase [Clostridiales bacterium]|nr:alanine--tRNA ligase [Clostridiales bacterium]